MITKKGAYGNDVKYSFDRIKKISLRLKYRAPASLFWAKPDPLPCKNEKLLAVLDPEFLIGSGSVP